MYLEFTATLLNQATPGKPLATEAPRTTSSRQHKLVKVSHPLYTAGSHARLLWTDVCSRQTRAQLLTVALHSKSLLIAHT